MSPANIRGKYRAQRADRPLRSAAACEHRRSDANAKRHAAKVKAVHGLPSRSINESEPSVLGAASPEKTYWSISNSSSKLCSFSMNARVM